MGITGNKILLVSSTYYLTEHLFPLMICTNARWQSDVKFIGKACLEQNVRTQQDFSPVYGSDMSEWTIPPPKAKQQRNK